MNQEEYRVVEDPIYHYYKLNPIPLEKEMTKFYESDYYDLIRKGGRACELRRLTAGGQEALAERRWLHKTLYTDIVHMLQQHSSNMRLLDIGCGSGEFLDYAKNSGFKTVGIEPSLEAASEARGKGIEVHCSSFEEFCCRHDRGSVEELFGSIVMLNVLEHVPDPVNLLQTTKALLKPGGILCVRVPNDFSEIQLAAQRKVGKEPWWVAVPDHINYFSFDSLHLLFNKMGFEIVHSQGDFPMEIFLLMGEDYIGNAEIGNACHGRRVSYELSVGEELRRKICGALGKAGVGRNCLVFGRVK